MSAAVQVATLYRSSQPYLTVFQLQVLGLPSAQPLLAGRHPTQSLCKAAMSARELQTCKVDKKELRKETRAKLKELSQDEKVQQSMPCSTWQCLCA